MVPVVSFVGNSGVGKTTFLEKLIPVLKSRGYRIASIKHDVHNFVIDYPGKDSWRLTQAGSDIVVLSSSTKLAVLETVQEDRSLTDLVEMVSDRVDLVVTEGYRGAAALKIEVAGGARHFPHSEARRPSRDRYRSPFRDQRAPVRPRGCSPCSGFHCQALRRQGTAGDVQS
jgi:molybdopterin-guanine dinucleotide biosynthesis protein B